MVKLSYRNQPAIGFAKTVKEVVSLQNEYAKIIMDRSQPITEELIGALIAQGVLSYEKRNPAPALDQDGNLQVTDLDLLSFLVPLSWRRAVIEIPEYRNHRQTVKRSNERKIGDSSFGPLVNLVSNQRSFAFSVKIHDKSIAVDDGSESEDLGAYRNYMVVDGNGRLYDGWDKIVWKPTAEENSFLKEKGLFTGNSVHFKHFVHPNRWKSVFGAPHLLKKMLLARLTDEAKFYRKEIKRLHGLGIYCLSGLGKKPKVKTFRGPTEKRMIETMEMQLGLPKFTGEYQPVEDTQKGLLDAYARQRILTYRWKPAVQFVVRANEAAFFLYGLKEDGKGRVASWLKKCRWVEGKKSPRSKLYQIMKLGDEVSLLYRIKTITEHVAV